MLHLMRSILAFNYCCPEIELQGGIKVTVTDEQAATYAAARKKDKEERDGFATAAGAAKAAADAATAAATKAEADRALAEASKKGELEKVREIATADISKQLAALQQHTAATALRATIVSIAPTLDGEAQTDILSLLQGRASFDAAAGKLVMKDAAGQPILNTDGTPKAADAVVREFLQSRKHFQAAVIPPQTNAGGTQKGAPVIAAKMTQAEYEKAVQDGQGQALAKRMVDKTLVLEG